jgi:hypothetical protein
MRRQLAFGRIAGYDDSNGADRLGCDPAMRWMVDGYAATQQAAGRQARGLGGEAS